MLKKENNTNNPNQSRQNLPEQTNGKLSYAEARRRADEMVRSNGQKSAYKFK